MNGPVSLTELLERLRPGSARDSVSVGDILHDIGKDSFAPVILVPALLLVSPLSAIPTVPTFAALIILTIALQWIVGRRHLWLPRFLMQRRLDAGRLDRALDFLERPAAWLDRNSRDRLKLLVMPPFSLVSKLCVPLIALTWPVLELLPMVTSIGAGAVSLFAFGMMMRDGIYVLAGYVMIGAFATLIFWLTGAG